MQAKRRRLVEEEELQSMKDIHMYAKMGFDYNIQCMPSSSSLKTSIVPPTGDQRQSNSKVIKWSIKHDEGVVGIVKSL